MNALLRIVAWTLAVVLVALPVVAVVNGWVGSERWPLRTLRIHGEFQRVDAREVRELVLPFARKGFFAVELGDAQNAVAALPWVEQVQVSKRWPDVLEVSVVEHEPFARWGKDRLLSEHGRLFPAEGIALPKDFLQLSGPDTQVDEVVALYNEARAMFSGSSQVRSVALDRRGSWSLTLSTGTQVLVGRNDARPRLARFARALPQLRAHASQPLARADLRYTNGFALVWGEKPEAGSGKPETGKQDSSRKVSRASSGYRLPATGFHSPVLAGSHSADHATQAIT